MRHFLPILFLLIPPSFVGYAEAKPRSKINGGKGSFERLLTKNHWLIPPKFTTYELGNIYKGESELLASKDRCFDAEVQENEKKQINYEVAQAMNAGAKIPLGVARVKTEATAYRQVSYENPFTKEFEAMQLELKPSCQSWLSSRPDITDMVVITAVLKAEYKETSGRSVDGLGGALGAGSSGGHQRSSSRESQGHIVVAYRSKPVSSSCEWSYPGEFVRNRRLEFEYSVCFARGWT
jgi:hypothetical protein